MEERRKTRLEERGKQEERGREGGRGNRKTESGYIG